MQFGGRPFNTAALTLDQWMWCILFGVGVLVWGQIITTIPTKRIPKQFSWGSGPPDEMIDATSSLVEDGSSGSLSQDVKRTGQILWIRGLTRLQTQVCLIQLHNSTVSQSQQLSLKRQSLGSPTSPTSLAAAALATGSTAAHSAPSAGGDSGSQLGSSASASQQTGQTHRTQNSTRPDTIEEAPELPGEVPQTNTAQANSSETRPTSVDSRRRPASSRGSEGAERAPPTAPPPGAPPPGRPYRPPAETPPTNTNTPTSNNSSSHNHDPLESTGASRGVGAGASVPIANQGLNHSSEPAGSSALEEQQINGDEQDMR